MLIRFTSSLLLMAVCLMGCDQPVQQPLPPAGMAGAPTAPMVAGGGLNLPGTGAAGGAGGAGGSNLPPNHPPVPGMGTGSPAAMPPPLTGGGAASGSFSGEVLEVLNVPTYTYLRVRTPTAEEWVAVNTAEVKVGDKVTVAQQLVSEPFTSKALNRTFPRLVMGTLVP
jgi:hypothetical protein